MKNQKGLVTIVGLFIALILIMALASAVSKPVSDSKYTNQQYENPVIQVNTNSANQNTQYPMQSVQTACNYMGGSWYQNTNTCAGNIDTKKCSLYGGRVNECDSSCRYAGSRTCYTTCETTCVFNSPYIAPNQQYQNTTYYPAPVQNTVYEIINNIPTNTIQPTDNSLSKYCSSSWYLVDGNICPTGMTCDMMMKPVYLKNYTTGETFNLSVDSYQWLKNNCSVKPSGLL